MQAQLAGLLAHEQAPLVLAQRASGVAAPAPRFTSLLNCRHSSGAADRRGSGPGLAGIEPVFVRNIPSTSYPLAVAVDDTGTGFTLTVDAVRPADPEQVCALLRTAAANLITALGTPPPPRCTGWTSCPRTTTR